MASDWTVTIDGDDYSPIPEGWIEGGIDAPGNSDGPRLYAVSARVTSTCRSIVVRYGYPPEGEVVQLRHDAKCNTSEGTYLPLALTHQLDDWIASFVPMPGPEEFPPLRSPEYDHLEALWGDRVSVDMTDRRAVADGGERHG